MYAIYAMQLCYAYWQFVSYSMVYLLYSYKSKEEQLIYKR